jgi:hypothetical protein
MNWTSLTQQTKISKRMKNYVKLFEEFVLSNPAEEISLKKQFATSAVTANVPISRNVSTIVSDKDGMRTVIGQQEPTAVVVVPTTEEDAKDDKK